MPIIYGVSPSPFVRKTIIFHQEKNIPYTLNVVYPSDNSPEFRKISPLGKIPGYTTDIGAEFSDSSVICAYLERTNPEPALYPENNEDYANALWLEEYCDSRMMEATGGLYFQKLIKPAFSKEPTDEAAVDLILTEKLPTALGYMEEKITGKKWLVGDKLSIADISLVANLVNLVHVKFDLSPWPELSRYYAQWKERESLQHCLKIEKEVFSQAGH